MEGREESLERLERELGLKRLNPAWAKLEILLGLFALSIGILHGVRTAVQEGLARQDVSWTDWLGHAGLIVLGGYLALAGHRSHLYQSNNRLAAYLADRARKTHEVETPK